MNPEEPSEEYLEAREKYQRVRLAYIRTRDQFRVGECDLTTFLASCDRILAARNEFDAAERKENSRKILNLLKNET